MKKIAFCFFTYDNINNLELWNKFFEQASPDQYSIYTHANYPANITQDFMKNHLIAEHMDASYAHISKSRAMLKLIQTSFEDQNTYKAINLTNSCIPIRPFQRVYNDLTQHNLGMLDWFNAADCTDRAYADRRNSLKDQSFMSAEEWIAFMGYGIVFSKPLIDFLTTHDRTDLFENMFGPDEHYIGNNLLHYGRTEDLVERRHVHRNHVTGGGAHGGMSHVSEDLINFARNDRNDTTLFLRKVATGALIPDMCIQ